MILCASVTLCEISFGQYSSTAILRVILVYIPARSAGGGLMGAEQGLQISTGGDGGKAGYHVVGNEAFA